MPKSYRIRTKVNEDSFVRVNLEQDFDLLEILSLKLTQSEVYSRMCADYGLVVGRVMANGGLGLPNAKVAIFIPLSDKDEQDPVIKEMYPFMDVNDKNEDGYRYNLLPKTKQHNRHTPTGSMYSAEETISNPLKLEVYEKYYKYTVKTNENGDYMIWGVPLGSHQIHMSVDVSDIGCHSMKPFDFIAQGVPIEKFKNSAIFDGSENLDTLPQIIIQNKTLEVVPFWGDDGLCNTGISRVDFDLRDSNVEFKPNALLMGSIMTDDSSNDVGWKCKPSKNMGEMCKMTTGSGKIESIRFTVHKEDDECTPKLEKFNVHNIDGSGSFVARIPMNLDYIYTDEYGNEQMSDSPSIGVPSRGKYRFRISFDQKYSSETRKGSYLVPNVREYTNDIPSSYSFSERLIDYPEAVTVGIINSPAFLCEDYFYEFTPQRVYTIGQHIDMYRNDYTGNDFNGGSVNPSSSVFPYFKRLGSGEGRSRWDFIGIKSTNPPYEANCSSTIKEFPANDGFRGGSFLFLTTQINLFITQLSIFVPFMLLAVTIVFTSDAMFSQLGWSMLNLSSSMGAVIGATWNSVTFQWSALANALGDLAGSALKLIYILMISKLLTNALSSLKYRLPLTKYDECENCNCGDFFSLDFAVFFGIPLIDEVSGDPSVNDPACQIPQLNSSYDRLYYSELHNEEIGDNSSKGCYTVSFDGSGFQASFNTAVGAMFTAAILAAFIPGLSSAVWSITTQATEIYVVAMATFLLFRLRLIFLSLNEWRVRKNIYNGLCQGVFNLGFWNSWIRGTLYHFRFGNKKGAVPNEEEDFYCRDVVVGPNETNDAHYYYRSCPYDVSTGMFNTPGRMPTTFTYTDVNGSQDSVVYRYKNGISYPTTIIELGTFEDFKNSTHCIDCDSDSSSDFFIGRLESSSQKNSSGVLDYVINQKMMNYSSSEVQFTGVNNWFGGKVTYNMGVWPPQQNTGNRNNRNSGLGGVRRLLDGDIAQLVSSNNEFGTYKFQSLFYYPSDVNYGPLPQTVVDPRINNSITRISSTISDFTLRDYLVGGTAGYGRSQQIPYYKWNVPPASYGSRNNDWDRTQIQTNRGQNGITISPPYAPIDVTNVSGGGGVSQGFFHYYFGLYQGNGAYDKFVNDYMPPID